MITALPAAASLEGAQADDWTIDDSTTTTESNSSSAHHVFPRHALSEEPGPGSITSSIVDLSRAREPDRIEKLEARVRSRADDYAEGLISLAKDARDTRNEELALFGRVESVPALKSDSHGLTFTFNKLTNAIKRGQIDFNAAVKFVEKTFALWLPRMAVAQLVEEVKEEKTTN